MTLMKALLSTARPIPSVRLLLQRVRRSNGLLICLAAALATPSAVDAETLDVWLLAVNGSQRGAYLREVNAFTERYPNLQIKLSIYENEKYKALLGPTLRGPKPPDIMFMFAGAGIANAVSEKLLAPLDDIWQAGVADSLSPALASSVEVDGKHYGLPLHYYQWGIYYNKQVFERERLAPPRNWAELLDSCTALRKANIAPVSLSSKDHWPVAGWFDYINLRINGLEFHKKLLSGAYSWKSARVRAVFDSWSQLIERDCYIDGHEDLDWKASLPYLYRGKAGMTLMGNFWTSQLPRNLAASIGFLPFPVIDSKQSAYEDSPTDVLVLTAKSRNKEAAKTFLRFFASPEVQTNIAKSVGMLPANKLSAIPDNDVFLSEGKALLEKTRGVAQYFDRDTSAEFSAAAFDVFDRFVQKRLTIAQAQDELEAARNKLFVKSNKN